MPMIRLPSEGGRRIHSSKKNKLFSFIPKPLPDYALSNPLPFYMVLSF